MALSLLAELLFLSCLQLCPLLFTLLRRQHALFSFHLAGLFVFTTWQTFSLVFHPEHPLFPEAIQATHLLICSTVVLYLVYGTGAYFAGYKHNEHTQFGLPFSQVFILSAFLIILFHSPIRTTSLTALGLAIMLCLAVLLTLDENRWQFLGKSAVLGYVLLSFLLNSSTQAAVDIAVVSLLLAILHPRKSTVIWLSLVLSLTLVLEINKSRYRRFSTTAAADTPLRQRTDVLKEVAIMIDGRAGFEPSVLSTKGLFGRDVPLVWHSPHLKIRKLPRFSKPLGYPKLKQLGIADAYYQFLLDHMELLLAPSGIFNEGLLYQPPTRPVVTLQDELKRSFIRLGNDSLVKVLLFTPRIHPFLKGESYAELPLIFIPRILWKEKPAIKFWNGFGKKYRLLEGADYSTSISFTYLTEGYMNFGKTGMFLSAALVAFLLLGLENLAQKMKQRRSAFFFMALMATATFAPFESFTLLSRIYQRGSLLLLFFALSAVQWAHRSRYRKADVPRGCVL